MEFRLIAALILVFASSSLAKARDCDFSDRQAVEAALVSHSGFSSAGRGALAIGEGKCSRITNQCERYLFIGHCDSVTYAHPPGDARNPLSLVFLNGSGDCLSALCADSFLSAAMIFPPNSRYRPAVEFIRNDSVRWQWTSGANTTGGYAKAISWPQAIVDHLQRLTDPQSTPRGLIDLGLLWHSSFVQGSNWRPRTVQTWETRDRVVWKNDLERCAADCTMKLFLIKFEEAPGVPTSLLRISGNMAAHEAMMLRTHAEVDGAPYDRTVEFHFVIP